MDLPSFDAIRDKLRASPLLIVFLITFILVALLAPAKVGLTLFGLSKLCLGGYVGYWIDRATFRAEARPHRLEGIAQGTAWKRRSVIIAAAVIAAALIP